jgi:hypothetical protein
MSTQSTLKHERDDTTRQEFHLYNDLYDEDHVYLALEGFHFEAASSMNLSGEWGSRLTLKLPCGWARKLGLIETVPVPDPETAEGE